ncbi:neural proliferation differentiation and control protein 1a [Parambassis ranga]|uniref:Neural proliferation differentiation and control protein 1a n=1 Tax=Parambassis ranga TaxID=210632 RepID=A0A6P7JCR4_9TELE|nr:neural proliferation differentiation and control protein 1-like [Parambassis ranga]
MLLLPSPRYARQRRASLLLLAAVLLCVVSVSARLPVTSYSNLDEEIDFLQSIIAKQEVSDLKTTQQQTKHHAAITSLSAAKLRQRHQGTSTAAPHTTLTDPPNTPTPKPRVTGTDGRAGPIAVPTPKNDNIIVIVISLCVVVGTVAVILATVCYIKLQKDSRLAEKVDYPAFKGASMPPVTANGASMGDKTLAQNAQMYHYQHQKQQMLSMENNKPEQKVIDTDVTSDEEEVGGDFTVYECPGLAPTGEMEVKNPLFDDSAIHYQENHK